jgi:hypothetical protein
MSGFQSRIASHVWRGTKILAVAGCCLAQIGCVQRRFTVRSNPPGALVYVDNKEIGTTPISHDFIYYGTRQIRLIKDGYETLVVNTPFTTPWYELPGIDFVSENLVPGEIRDHRVLDFQLTPQVIVPTEQLMGRAEELRRSNNPGATAPPALPGVAQPPVAAPGAFPQTPNGAPPALPPGAAIAAPPNVLANPPARAIPQPQPAVPLGPPSGGTVPPPSGF